jgi:hypothetical protein
MQKPLTPRTKIDSEGKIAYSESFQAWNTLNLKKELFSEFPQLKEKRSKFTYKLVYFRDSKEMEEEIRRISKSGASRPLLLWIYKED